MNNFEQITQNIDELAYFLQDTVSCNECPIITLCEDKKEIHNCLGVWKYWLLLESEEEEC